MIRVPDKRTTYRRLSKSALVMVTTGMLICQSLPLSLMAQAAESKKVDAVYNDLKIEQVALMLSNATGNSITLYGGKVNAARVTVLERNLEFEEVLDKITKPQGWVWFKMDDGSYGISDEGWYRQNILPSKTIQKIFRPDHVKASELEKAIRPMLSQGISSVTADDRTNKLIVQDLPDIIEKVERLIREIDVQLFTRVFYIRHGDVNDIAEKIETYKSDPGTIEVDEKTHQIIVSDLLSNIKKMELLIDILDVGPEIVIYDVNNIGLEGADLEELQAIIDNIRTPDLLFEINEKQGVFILEDVPEIHERVEQILEGFDRPVKQVLIQAEILSTTFSRNFGLGLKRAAHTSLNSITGEKTTTTTAGDPPVTTTTTTPYDSGDLGFSPFGALDSYTSLSGSVLTGALLQNQAYFEWQATFEDVETKVLLQPRLLVKNQESSQIIVGSEEPFLTTFFDDNDNGNSTRSTSQSTVTDGLQFEITPSISNSYLVEMDIQIDNDDAQPVDVPDGSGTVRLIRQDKQSIETVLTIPSGQTRVIGGLITTGKSQSTSGVPFLSKLPWIGYLFGSKTKGSVRDNLQVFITPTIVEDEIPRPTSKDGRRGRMVSGYENVPGQYDMDVNAEMMETAPSVDDESLFSFDGNLNTEDAIEELLRDETPRAAVEKKERDSNYTPRSTGGSASIGGNGSSNTGSASGGGSSSSGGDASPSGGSSTHSSDDTPPVPPSPPPGNETQY